MRLFILCCFFLLISNVLFANGGPIEGSLLYKTGNIFFIQENNLNIEKEVIKITFTENKYIEYNIIYKILNKSDKNVQIKYAFPIDFHDIGELETAESDLKTFLDNKISDFILKIDGEAQSFTFCDTVDENKDFLQKNKCVESSLNKAVNVCATVDKSKNSFQKNQCVLDAFKYASTLYRYYISNLNIPVNKSVDLSISYKIEPHHFMSEYSGEIIPNYSVYESRYNLFPAGYFSNGNADNIEIAIDVKDLIKSGGVLLDLKPDIFSFEKDGIFKYEGKNFSYKKNREIYIKYDNSFYDTYKFIYKNKVVEGKKLFNLKTSSFLANYNPLNLFDGNPETAWCEGAEGDGKKEWIEFDITGCPRVISILNGYAKNKFLLEQNGKLKKIKMRIDCGIKEKIVEKEILIKNDENFEWQKRSNDKIADNILKLVKNNKEIQEPPIYLRLQNVFHDYYGICEYKTCNIRLTIEDVYPGGKFKDTCISDIFILQEDKNKNVIHGYDIPLK